MFCKQLDYANAVLGTYAPDGAAGGLESADRPQPRPALSESVVVSALNLALYFRADVRQFPACSTRVGEQAASDSVFGEALDQAVNFGQMGASLEQEVSTKLWQCEQAL